MRLLLRWLTKKLQSSAAYIVVGEDHTENDCIFPYWKRETADKSLSNAYILLPLPDDVNGVLRRTIRRITAIQSWFSVNWNSARLALASERASYRWRLRRHARQVYHFLAASAPAIEAPLAGATVHKEGVLLKSQLDHSECRFDLGAQLVPPKSPNASCSDRRTSPNLDALRLGR